MKIKILSLCLVSFACLSSASGETETRPTHPNALYAEVLGRAYRFGFGFDRVIDDHLAAGINIGWTKVKHDVLGSKSVTVFTPYASYYFIQDQGSPFVTAGMSLFSGDGSSTGYRTQPGGLKLSDTAIAPQIGAGYENRGDTGFLFRVAGYLTLDASVSPWIGMTFGLAF